MSINSPYVKGSSEKLRPILRTGKIRSTFYTKNTLCKLLCEHKDLVTAQDNNNIVYDNDCGNCEVAYFSVSVVLIFPHSDWTWRDTWLSLCIQSEYGDIRTRKNSVFGNFSRSERSLKNCDSKQRKLQNTFWKRITTLTGIERNMLIRKAH